MRKITGKTSERVGQTGKRGRAVRILAAAMMLCLMGSLLSGCGKENKYVNVGVEMSTAGMSLYLTNTANGLQKISTYVFFAESPEAAVDKVCQDKQGIDLTYLDAKDLALITADRPLRVIFVDCFDESGAVKGVWVAREGWLASAPNYSYKYVLGLVKSADYRADHFTMTYPEALETVKGKKDFDFEEMTEVMQYMAVYAESNSETLKDEPFTVMDAAALRTLFAGFEEVSGDGYTLCRDLYEAYLAEIPAGSEAKAFEELFDFSLMQRALDEVVNGIEE